VRYWDASAVVPLLVSESQTPTAIALLQGDSGMVVWWATRTECVSALSRKRRDGELSPLKHAQARVRLQRLQDAWTEMQPVPQVRALAETLLHRYPLLRTADALQLAAAVRWRGGAPSGAGFVSLDDRLRSAAVHEGFTVLPTTPVPGP
jgi:predicted nucleic acid-binding protein